MWIFLIIIGIIILYNLFSSSSKSSTRSTYYSQTKYTSTTSLQKPILPTKKIFRSKIKLPDNLVITEEFNRAFDMMENTKKSAYITGKAGTGKSTLLTYFRKRTKKNVIVLSPSGIAAINVEGSTIHSFFRFAPQLIKKETIKRDLNRHDLFNKLEMVIIDEISMVRADLLDAIDYSLRLNRKSNSPFGGIQMIFFGDLYQLPPVVADKELSTYFEEHFGGPYFFNAKVFDEISFDYIELQTIFRQTDNEFKSILNSIRENKVTNKELLLLNERYNPTHTYDSHDVKLTLSTTNKIAEEINQERMNSLISKEYFYSASISGRFEKNSYPTESLLVLKEGAQIMMLKNDSQKKWVNGSLGTIKHLLENEVSVNINGSTYIIEKTTWEIIEYQYNKEEEKIDAIVTGSFTQYPIKLAWAITIHKSQGQTFDKVVIDLGNGAFAHGQTYVALSRCTTLEGITLRTRIQLQDIIVDPKVAKFIREKTQHFSN